jgi:hypothetical protein
MKTNDYDNQLFVRRDLLETIDDTIASLIPQICVVGEVKPFKEIVDAILDAPELVNALAGYPETQKKFITGDSVTVANTSNLVRDRVVHNVGNMKDDSGLVTYRPIIC